MNTLSGSLDPKSHSLEFLIKIQAEIAASVRTEDEFGILETIAGLDCAFISDLMTCGVNLLDYHTRDIIKKAYVVRNTNFPYIPT
ncbi:MAG: endonuclease V [Halobacteriota archaeon]